MSILDELHKVFRELPPPPRWNGEVRKDFVLLPYQGAAPCDMCGGDGLTSDGLDRCYKCDGAKTQPGPMVHAVLVDRTLFVSKEAWEALATYPDVILGKLPRVQPPPPPARGDDGGGDEYPRIRSLLTAVTAAAATGGGTYFGHLDYGSPRPKGECGHSQYGTSRSTGARIDSCLCGWRRVNLGEWKARGSDGR